MVNAEKVELSFHDWETLVSRLETFRWLRLPSETGGALEEEEVFVSL